MLRDDDERQRFITALFSVGHPDWDMIADRARLQGRTRADVYAYARQIVQLCCKYADNNDYGTFIGFLQLILESGKDDERLVAAIPNTVADEDDMPIDDRYYKFLKK